MWQVYLSLHKRLNAVCRLLTPRVCQEPMEVNMLDADAGLQQTLRNFWDTLLEWRWGFLQRAGASIWRPAARGIWLRCADP